MTYGENNSISIKCTNCGNDIIISYVKFIDLENDTENITYECEKCKAHGTCIIMNSETSVITGAEIISTEFLD